MPTFTHGKEATVFINGYEVSDHLNSVTVSGEADTVEVSTLGTSDKAYIGGMRDATVSAEGFYAGASSDIDSEMSTNLGATTTWTAVMEADAIGATAYGVRAIETTYEVGAEIGGAVAITVEGQVTERREAARVLHPHGSETSTGTTTGLDNSASTANGAAAYLQVTAASGTTPTLDVKVQHSSDGTTYADLLTFTQVTAANAYERVATTGTVNRYLRVEFTIGGTSPDFTFHVAAARL
jgi:hypothetical protein